VFKNNFNLVLLFKKSFFFPFLFILRVQKSSMLFCKIQSLLKKKQKILINKQKILISEIRVACKFVDDRSSPA